MSMSGNVLQCKLDAFYNNVKIVTGKPDHMLIL